MDELLARADDRPILVGLSDIGNTGFVTVSVAADLLSLEVSYIAGYPGSRETSMGLIRGEFDLLGVTFDSVVDRVEAGDLLPIFQVSDAPVSNHPSLARVPLLGGPDGLAVRRALARGEDPARAMALAGAMSRLFGIGRLVVGPQELDPRLTRCLADHLAEVARDSAFLAAASQAQRTVAFETPAAIAKQLEATAADRQALVPILSRHAELVRGGVPGR